jgi:FkbM family methyltransferase
MLSTARHAVMRGAERLGIDDQLKHLRALTNPGLRRDLRDHTTFRAIIAAVVPRDGHTIDVGAHKGDVIAELVRVAPDGRHIAYEPLPEFARGLRERFPQIDVREAALWDAAGETTFEYVANLPGYSGLRRGRLPRDANVKQIRVSLERLDDTLAEDFRPAFIKIDVNGAELQVLRGARETLLRHRPVVAFEHGRGFAEVYGATPAMVHDLLVAECGMRIFDLVGDGPYSRDHFEEVFEQPIWNFVACP